MFVDAPLKPNVMMDSQYIDDTKDEIINLINCINGLHLNNKEKENLDNRGKGSLTVSINGSWGSGKTTILRTLEDYYKYIEAPVVFFEAWKYQKDENIMHSLLLDIHDIEGLDIKIKNKKTSGSDPF